MRGKGRVRGQESKVRGQRPVPYPGTGCKVRCRDRGRIRAEAIESGVKERGQGAESG